MAEGKRKDDWDHTAQLLACLCEINRDPKRRSTPFTSGTFHPFREVDRVKRRSDVKAQLSLLKAATVDPT